MDKNTQQPVAVRWRYGAECDDTRWHFSEIPIGSYLDRTIEPLYLAPPRDVLMAAMREVQEQSAVFAKQYVVSEPFIRHCINLGEIADRYASQVQPEPVNQQTLAALKRLLECYKMADHHDGYCCCGSPMATHDDPMNCGHCATDAGEYNAGLVIKDMESAIAAAEAAQPDHIVDADKMVQAQPVAVPDGWRFCSADFSLQAAGKSKTGSVLLVRDPDGCAEWLKLSDDIKEIVPLYLSGKGNTVDEAIADAVSHRVFLSAAQKPEGV